MPPWTCPECGRRFGRRGQSHQCEPAMPLQDWYDSRPAAYRPICEAVLGHLESLGPVEVDAVHVGLLVKRSRTFVELRPSRAGLRLSFLLSRTLEHPRIVRAVDAGRRGGRVAHFVELRGAEDVDDLVRGWLTEAYLASPE